MLQLDPRAGSGDLLPLLVRRSIPVEHVTLPFGDAALEGRGPDDRPVLVGVEIKRVGDLLRCMVDGRFSGHQLPGMAKSFEVNWLVVEGGWRAGKEDMLEVPWGADNGRKANPPGRTSFGSLTGNRKPKGGARWGEPDLGSRQMQCGDVEKFLITVQMMGGFRVKQTRDREDTAIFLAALYRWWTGKAWEDHHSHLRFNESDGIGESPAHALLRPPNNLRRFAKDLPGIGWKKSRAVDNHFDSIWDAVNAEETAWSKIEGVGKTMAARIWEYLRTKRN